MDTHRERLTEAERRIRRNRDLIMQAWPEIRHLMAAFPDANVSLGLRDIAADMYRACGLPVENLTRKSDAA